MNENDDAGRSTGLSLVANHQKKNKVVAQNHKLGFSLRNRKNGPCKFEFFIFLLLCPLVDNFLDCFALRFAFWAIFGWKIKHTNSHMASSNFIRSCWRKWREIPCSWIPWKYERDGSWHRPSFFWTSSKYNPVHKRHLSISPFWLPITLFCSFVLLSQNKVLKVKHEKGDLDKGCLQIHHK